MRPSAAEQLRRHTQTRVVVLADRRILFVPMPKSGCTSVLWTLADLAGLDRQRFTSTRMAEISRAMAIHDMTLWRPEHVWANHSADEQAAILAASDWMRLTVVRDPAPRLWSAWQSKVLLQEPRFVRRFADEPWWPGDVRTVDDVVAAFRDFVRALDTDPDLAPHDAHWGPQTGLLDGFPMTFVGHAEDPDATRAAIGAHIGDPGRLAGPVPRENANPIPYSPCVYDAATADVLNRVFAADFETYGYPLLDLTGTSEEKAREWRELASSRMRLVSELTERHLRIGELLTELELGDQEVLRLEQVIEQLRDRLIAAEAGLAAAHGSLSWRLTRPLRAARRRL